MPLLRLIAQIEDHFGLKLDEERLKEAVALSSRASTLWRQTLETARTHPSPLTFFDGLIHMAPVIVLRGSQTAVDYYEELLAEMGERVRSGVGAVHGPVVGGGPRAASAARNDSRPAAAAASDRSDRLSFRAYRDVRHR